MSAEETGPAGKRLGNAAIFYHPDSHVADRPKVMGRHSAGAGFLEGFVEHAETDSFVFYLQKRAHLVALQQQLAGASRTRRARVIHADQDAKLAQAGCLMLPGPGLGEAAWNRRAQGDRAYSLCGVTHTISSSPVLEGFGELLTAPVQPWDALICTSRCVRGEVRGVLESYAEYLERRTGGRPPIDVRLPVIPLGVNVGRYAPEPELRARLRAEIGAAESDTVVLFLGRLSFHAKANPLPLIQAVERAAQRSDTPIHLLFVGQIPNDFVGRSFRQAATLARTARVHFRSGADPRMVAAAWRAADVFASLSDNVQESFGLTVVEAMAAGLPVLASDWDGYRDTVRDGVTGFLVPTTFAPAGVGEELAERHRRGEGTYDRYVGAVSLCTAIDVDSAAAALARLAADPELRARMGAAGRAAAEARFDWRHVVRAYQELWAELEDIREASGGTGVRGPDEPAHPLHRDPFALFADHASGPLTPDLVMRIVDAPLAEAVLEMNVATYDRDALLLPPEAIRAVVRRLDGAPQPVSSLLNAVSPEKRAQLTRTLVWLLKFGVASTERA